MDAFQTGAILKSTNAYIFHRYTLNIRWNNKLARAASISGDHSIGIITIQIYLIHFIFKPIRYTDTVGVFNPDIICQRMRLRGSIVRADNRQIFAQIKRILADGRHAIGYRNPFKIDAPRKRPRADARRPLRHDDLRQRSIPHERFFLNRLDGVGQRKRLRACAGNSQNAEKQHQPHQQSDPAFPLRVCRSLVVLFHRFHRLPYCYTHIPGVL